MIVTAGRHFTELTSARLWHCLPNFHEGLKTREGLETERSVPFVPPIYASTSTLNPPYVMRLSSNGMFFWSIMLAIRGSFITFALT